MGDQSETTKTSYAHNEHPAQLLSLDSLPVASGASENDATHDILAVFDNGDVICLSAKLDVVRWVANLASLLSPGETRVDLEHISLATAKAVTRGLLRSREDVATVLNPTSDESSDLLELTQIVCIIGRKADGSRLLGLVQVQPRSANLPTNHLSPLKHLFSCDLPRPSKTSPTTTAQAQFALNPSSGALHVLAEGSLLSYDLAGTVPKLSSELTVPGSSIDSFLRTSQDILFTTSRHTCRVFDAKFNSLHAHLALDPASTTSDTTSPSKKRKHAQPESEEQTIGPNSLIAYYADIGLIVAAREDEIFGMQFGGVGTRKRTKTEGTLLVDALGKGLSSKSIIPTSHENQKWQDRKVKLDRYASKGKIAKFEEILAALLGIQLESTNIAKKQENEVNGGPLTNGVGPKVPDEDAMIIDKIDDEPVEDILQSWRIPKVLPDRQRKQYRQFALYALSKIFGWVDTGISSDVDPSKQQLQGSLKIDFFPPNVFQWLLQTGYLTKESIRKSLLDETPMNANLIPTINDGDIVKAIVDFDPELHILSALLNHEHFLPVGEVVQAIKLLIQSIEDLPEENETTKLLTNGTAPSEDGMEIDIASELEAASEEIDHALSMLNHGLLVRSHTLRPALMRLYTFPAPAISSTLRSKLTRRDLESLIRLLHLELKNGGWTSSYDFLSSEDMAMEASTEDPDDRAVTIIASLLSSTLDAVGAGAWVASIGSRSSSPDTPEEIIASLHSDASEALNGFWEARYMRGLISEFLRYASTVPKSKIPSNDKLQRQGKPFLVTGKLDGEEDLPMLPLGAKAESGVERMKKGQSGKKEERSKREMGMLISKRVPKYSFERIVL